MNLHIEHGSVTSASIGAGGVATTPVRAAKTEATLIGQPWTEATIQKAMRQLRAEFSPISDMRASGAYRTQVLGNLLQRYWLESQGMQQINLEAFQIEENPVSSTVPIRSLPDEEMRASLKAEGQGPSA